MSNQIQESKLSNMKLPVSEQITIGDALEITALTAGNKPIDQSDAAAIRAAELRASGFIQIAGLAAAAQLAADLNGQTIDVKKKTKLGDLLMDASNMLEDDKPVTMEDAEGVKGAEVQKNPDSVAYPGGVSASISSAAKINQDPTSQSGGE